MPSSVSLIEVCQTYDPARSPGQTLLLDWLDAQLHNPRLVPGAVLAEFSRLWHQTTALQPPAIAFPTVCHLYRQEQASPGGVPTHRDAALSWLERQLLSEAPALLSTFGQAWQQPDSVDVSTLTLPVGRAIIPSSAADRVSEFPTVSARGPLENLSPNPNHGGTVEAEGGRPCLAIGSRDLATADGPVHQLQRLLKYKFGYGRVLVNGDFDRGTEQAVRDLQLKRFGAAQVNGLVDDRTWQALLDEAPDRWLAFPDPLISGEVDLVEIARYFRLDSPETYGYYHQADAIRWLQSQVPPAIGVKFAQRYRGDAHTTPTLANPVPLDWVSAFAYYKDLPHQAEALQWLQAQIPTATLQDFAAYWRNPHLYPPDQALSPPAYLAASSPVPALASPEATPPFSLLRAYQQLHPIVTPEQQAALEWLQTQIPAAVLQEFSRLWSADDLPYGQPRPVGESF